MKYVILLLTLNSVIVLNFGLNAKTKKNNEIKNKDSVELLLKSYNTSAQAPKCEKFCKLERK